MGVNQTSFKKGEVHNPNGRPKRDWTWAGELQKAVERKYKDGTSVKEAVSNSLVDQAVGGNVVAAKELMNRMDGMPQQDITSDGEKITGPTVFIPKEEE